MTVFAANIAVIALKFTFILYIYFSTLSTLWNISNVQQQNMDNNMRMVAMKEFGTDCLALYLEFNRL